MGRLRGWAMFTVGTVAYVIAMGYFVLSDDQIHRDPSGTLWRPMPKLKGRHSVADRYIICYAALVLVWIASATYQHVAHFAKQFEQHSDVRNFVARSCFCMLVIALFVHHSIVKC
jgi:hypothetical protein